ncbi:MAG: hypothetical protein JWL63_2849 [Rhodocyclales bacterium]|nr:hypothetical protein [Rhodocyclales bacterium]
MVEALSGARLCAAVARCSVLFGLACTAPYALSQSLADPTRSAMPSKPAVSASAPVESVPAPQVGVGMVVTAREGVLALFEGRILRVGSRTDSGVVTHIAPDAVFIRSAAGKVTRWPLYPAVSVQREQAASGAEPEHGSRQDRSKTK